jgi:hypothetical protein
MMRLNRGAAAPALAAVAAPLPLLLLALLLPLASAQFTQITSTFLAGTCNVDDGFGAEDKMAICNGDLVFIDLDPDVSNVWRYRYQPAANAWSKDPLVALPCPDSGEGGLVPRETGYVIGQTKGPFGGDRLRPSCLWRQRQAHWAAALEAGEAQDERYAAHQALAQGRRQGVEAPVPRMHV